MNKLLTFLMLLLPAVTNGFGQTAADAPERIVAFRFVPGKDMFYIPWAGNGAELDRLYALVDEYRHEIASGRMPVQVDGYCASLPTVVENLRTARVRANRVKSELIVHKGLKEADFVTANYAHACDGNRDVVVVTLRIPATAEPPTVVPVADAPQREEPQKAAPVAAEARSEEPPTAPQPEPACEPTSKPTCEPACEQPSLRPVPEPEAQPAAPTDPAAEAQPQSQPKPEPQPAPEPRPEPTDKTEATDEAEATDKTKTIDDVDTTRLPPVSEQAPRPAADRSPDAARGRTPGPWSVGLHVGTPFFWGDMVTCAADGTRIGIMLGVEASYRINSLLGASLTAEWAQGRAGARAYARDFVLDAGGMTWYTPHAGVAYEDLYARIAMWSAGLHLDVNVLRLFGRRMERSRFRLVVSPAVYAQHFASKVHTRSDDRVYVGRRLSKGISLGLGGDVAVRYALTHRFDLQLKGTALWITDNAFDNIETGSKARLNALCGISVGVVWKIGSQRGKTNE